MRQSKANANANKNARAKQSKERKEIEKNWNSQKLHTKCICPWKIRRLPQICAVCETHHTKPPIYFIYILYFILIVGSVVSCSVGRCDMKWIEIKYARIVVHNSFWEQMKNVINETRQNKFYKNPRSRLPAGISYPSQNKWTSFINGELPKKKEEENKN